MTSEMSLQDLKDHWRKSSKIRIQKIKSLEPDAKISSILEEYSAYKRADGYFLVR